MSNKGKAVSGILMAALIILCGVGSVRAGQKEVITLLENETVQPGDVIEFDPIEVGRFQHVAFLGRGGTPAFPLINHAFISEPGLYSDPLPQNRDPSGGCPIQQDFVLGCSVEVRGPFLAVQLENPQGIGPHTITLQVFLSR